MAGRHDRMQAKARQARRYQALARPELGRDDHMTRRFCSAPVGPPIKEQDAETRRLIDEALAKRLEDG